MIFGRRIRPSRGERGGSARERMEFVADDREDEIIELEDILEMPEEEVSSVALDDAEVSDAVPALRRKVDAVSSVISAREDLFLFTPGLDDETGGVEDELEHAMIFDEDMQPAGEFEGWPSEIDFMEAVCESKSEPFAGGATDEDGGVAFAEPPIFTSDRIPMLGEEIRPEKQADFADDRDRVLHDATKEILGTTGSGALQFDFLPPEEEAHELLKNTGGMSGALSADQTTDIPPAGASLVLDGLIAQLETKLIMNIQRLLESKMPGIVASVIGEELENLKKYARQIENC
jgi:hypothetical protein